MVQTAVQWDTILSHGNNRTKLLIHARNVDESQSGMLSKKKSYQKE